MTDALASPRRTGELLDGRYRLEERIGSGGMATVYRAVDESLGRTVAVKLFPPGTAEPTDAQRKASETRVLASLNHHALVTLFDANVSSDDGAYLVMEYISGPTLAQRIEESPLPSAEVAAMALDLADALHVVHEARIVHRDIKPSNVLLRPSPTTEPAFRAKLADFGIAYLIDSARLTTPGLVVGTVAYLSPEQVRGASPAPPADVYALGLVLLEALTGRRAYPQPDRNEALFARLNEAPEIPGSLGYEWKSLLTAMTATDPDDRPTALEVAAAVRTMNTNNASPVDPDITSAMTAPVMADADAADAPTVRFDNAETPTKPAPVTPSSTGDEPRTDSTPATAPSTADSPETRNPRRALRRWILVAVLVLIVAAVIAGLVLWPMLQSGGTASAPDLPTLPAPLSTHLDQLMKEVSP
ncbi:Serine/threonine protein kinase [Paramicrobacterium humi]|uniref:non-specific serine/threonine protein kinase n=1 Tax=Paramicrobacterium humi TaxID=640635 RepID=A0A1H4LHH4_9MICO|nr:serine/threonine-protein kinase [Microbacterium humi]SEB70104.1 Serine/threonine protein kinase [Microbacterium humi]